MLEGSLKEGEKRRVVTYEEAKLLGGGVGGVGRLFYADL